MNSSRNTKDQLIKKQELYIRQLEGQLAVDEEKDKVSHSPFLLPVMTQSHQIKISINRT